MTPRLAQTPVLETDRLHLRAFAPADTAACTAFLTDARSRYVGGPYTAAGAWNACAGYIGHWALRGFGLFSICLKGSDRAIGDCALLHPGGYVEPELGWTIWSSTDEGRGYAREAAQAVRAHAYDDLGWSTLVSYIDPDNARSIALAQRLGCRLDADAPLPDLPDWEGTLVYRHPGPEAS